VWVDYKLNWWSDHLDKLKLPYVWKIHNVFHVSLLRKHVLDPNRVLPKLPKVAHEGDLLALSIRQRLCVNFYVSRANFLTILRSHLDVTCSYYFWSSLFNVDDESLHTLDK
jgi:hypothetical protein